MLSGTNDTKGFPVYFLLGWDRSSHAVAVSCLTLWLLALYTSISRSFTYWISRSTDSALSRSSRFRPSRPCSCSSSVSSSARFRCRYLQRHGGGEGGKPTTLTMTTLKFAFGVSCGFGLWVWLVVYEAGHIKAQYL